MKYTLLLFICTILFNCTSGDVLQCTSAAEIHRNGGVEGNQGINYSLRFLTKNPEQFQFDSLYIDGETYQLTNSNRADIGSIWYSLKLTSFSGSQNPR